MVSLNWQKWKMEQLVVLGWSEVYRGCVLSIRVQHSCSTFWGLSNWKIKTLPIFPLIGTGADIQRVWSLASMQTLQIACHNSPSPLFILARSLTIEQLLTQKSTNTDEAPRGHLHKHKTAAGLKVSQREWMWTVKLWQSCHHGIINCYCRTDSSSSQGVKEVEKLLPVSNWATWSKTSSLWGCSACGRSLAPSGNAVRPSLGSDRHNLFIHGQCRNKIIWNRVGCTQNGKM